jgi:hypothetical protein
MASPACSYGCGREAKYQLKNGKWCCSKSHNSCPAIIKSRDLLRSSGWDETGKTYGRLTVISRAGTQKKKAMWLCRCECGNEKIVPGIRLRNGDTRSCGCLQIENRSLPHGEAAFRRILQAYKRKAKYRGLKWNLSEEFFRGLTSGACYYCGMVPKQSARHAGCLCVNGDYLYNGIDRLDSSKGYSPENTVSCCGLCNRMKSDMSQMEFMDHIRSIYKYLGQE